MPMTHTLKYVFEKKIYRHVIYSTGKQPSVICPHVTERK